MNMNGSNWKRWVGVGELEGLQPIGTPPPEFVLGHFHKILDKPLNSSARAQLICNLLVRIGRKGGSVSMTGSQCHARS
eukprot:1161178-Pelagomonas_calceolata.AAC.11